MPANFLYRNSISRVSMLAFLFVLMLDGAASMQPPGATLAVLQALTCSVSPRLVFDGGFYIGPWALCRARPFFQG
jgi:hypothetical protein